MLARMKRVVLVSLPFTYFPESITDRWNYARPPLGIAALAAYIRARAATPVEVMCLDLLVEKIQDVASVVARILALEPDVVGLSVMTPTAPMAIRVAQQLKCLRPGIRVIAGGPHVTALPDEPFPGVDAKIVGEGEIALTRFLDEEPDLEGHDVPGLWKVAPDGQVRPAAPTRLIENIDDLPFAAMDLLPGHAYFHSFPYRGVHRFATLITARGCPGNCNFCGSRSMWGRRVRMMSADRVAAEVDWLVDRHGVDLLFFEDDTFTASRARTYEILAHIRRRQPRLRWICHTRVDAVDEDLVAEMAGSGCVEVQVGVESGDPEILSRTRKKISLDQAERAFRMFRQAGIRTWATFVIGHEDETVASLERTLASAKRLGPTYASFILLLPFPGTDVFRSFDEKGFLKTRNWEEYSWHGAPVFETPLLSSRDLMNFRSRANVQFYLRPAKLAEVAWRTLVAGSTREMMRNLIAWMSLVRQKTC